MGTRRGKGPSVKRAPGMETAQSIHELLRFAQDVFKHGCLGKERRRHDVLQREMLQPWLSAVRKIGNPLIAAYLQVLQVTGARREELAVLKWADVNFQSDGIKLSDKVEDFRMVPLTPFVAQLLASLSRRNAFVFSSPTFSRLLHYSLWYRSAPRFFRQGTPGFC